MNPSKIASRNAQFLQIYLQNGQNPIPIQKASKKPLIQWKEYQQKTYDKGFPDDCNIATICGIHSGEFVLDFDFDDIPEFAKKWINETLTIKSGKRGYHFHFRGDKKIPLPTRLQNNKNQFIDVLGDGKYAITAPSIHPETGNEYEIISPTTTIKEVDAEDLIRMLESAGFSKPKSKNSTEQISKGGISKGSRHTSAIKYVNHLLFKSSLDENTIRYEMNRWNQTNIPPLPQDELDRIISDAIQHHDGSAPKPDPTISGLSTHDYLEKLECERKDLLQNIEANFPNRSFAVKVCLSVKAQMKIEGITQPFTLIMMGNPSTNKSTILEIISSLSDCYVSDSFTPKSFVSHSANSSKKSLDEIDLLPKIKHKTLITPELAPLFSGNQDQLVEYFGMLTRILDGRGFQSDSGVHGKRGYSGDYYFTWIGAVIDIPHRVWSLLGNLGPKIYFFRLPEEHKAPEEEIQQIKQALKENSYVQRLESSKNAVSKFWHLIQNRPSQSDGKIQWDPQHDDEETLERIVQLAQVLSKLRATIPTWSTSDSNSGGSKYNFEIPIIENPSRASSALYNLARGHALLCGRNYIAKEDLSVVIPTALSSAPRERVELLRLLIENNGKLTTDQFIEFAKVSRATALKEMERLVILGLVIKLQEDNTTKPINVIHLKNEFSWFLTSEFSEYWKTFQSMLTPKNSKLLSDKDNLGKNILQETLDGA